jgi:hypothetical protein
MSDPYIEANQNMYDDFANQFRIACCQDQTKNTRYWLKTIKERMKVIDARLATTGEQ